MDFVVPIMFLRTTSCTAGWREFLTILSVNKARFTLYILFQIVIAMVIGAIVWMGFCIGCCLCCVSLLLLIPYIGTVILLPVHVFTRSYSLLYLKQFGPEFDVFSSETENLQSI
jgi:ABC-type transport system involved in multi-copper enzyme maturation permease subunit